VTIQGVPAKLRNPWLAFLWALVTLGIYYLFWYYRTNKELRDVANIDVSPGIATVAISIGSLVVVPPFVSTWRYFKRIRQAQEAAGVDHPVSHVTGFVLFLIAFFLLPVEIPYAQHHLNRLWRHKLDEESKRLSGMRGQPATTF
jgi:heme/copper-type cytochrome/quinol oxidase subunit 2